MANYKRKTNKELVSELQKLQQKVDALTLEKKNGSPAMLDKKSSSNGHLEAEEYFELLFNTSPDSVIITRLNDGVVMNSNHGFTKLTGYTSEEVLGKTTSEISI